MTHNAEVRAAYEDTQKTLELLAEVQAMPAPPELKQKVWKRIQEQDHSDKKPAGESHNLATLPKKGSAKSSNWKMSAVAASVLLLLSLAGNLFFVNDRSGYQKQKHDLQAKNESYKIENNLLAQQLAVLTNPDIETIHLKGVEKHPDAQAMVYWDKTSKKVYLNAQDLPKTPKGMQYQLWAIQDGKPVSAGLYVQDKNFSVAISSIESAQAFAITLEKEGGSDTPTMENMFVLGTI